MSTPTNRNNGPVLDGGKLDPRFGVILSTKQQGIASTNGALSQDPTLVNETGMIGAVEIAPKTKELAEAHTTYVPVLPADIVAYAARDASFLPETLLDVALVGTEDLAFSYDMASPPQGPLLSRLTYKFFYGPPPQSAIPTLTTFYPRTFVGAFEYTRTKHVANSSVASEQVQRTSNDTTQRTSTDFLNRSGVESNTTTGTESGTHSVFERSTGNLTESSTGSSNTNESHKSTRNHTTTDSGKGTSNTSSTETHNTYDTIKETGTNQSTGTSNSTTTTPGGTHTTLQFETTTGQEARTVTDSGGAPLTTDETTNAAFIRQTNSTVQTTTTGNSTSTESGTHNTTLARNTQETRIGGGTHQNATNSTSTHTGVATLQLTSVGQTQSDNTAQHASSRQSNSNSNSTTNGTRQGQSNTTLTATFNTTSKENASGNVVSNSNSNSTSNSSNASTGKEILVVHIPASIHPAIVVSNGSLTFTIPATTPTAIPSGWLTILATPSHWEAGIWVLEIHEVFIP